MCVSDPAPASPPLCNRTQLSGTLIHWCLLRAQSGGVCDHGGLSESLLRCGGPFKSVLPSFLSGLNCFELHLTDEEIKVLTCPGLRSWPAVPGSTRGPWGHPVSTFLGRSAVTRCKQLARGHLAPTCKAGAGTCPVCGSWALRGLPDSPAGPSSWPPPLH